MEQQKESEDILRLRAMLRTLNESERQRFILLSIAMLEQERKVKAAGK